MKAKTPLAKYLARTKRSQGDLARAVGAARSQITRIANGLRGASGPLAAAIEAETKGEVTAASLWPRRSKGGGRGVHSTSVPPRAA